MSLQPSDHQYRALELKYEFKQVPVQAVDADSRVVLCRMHAPQAVGTVSAYLVDIKGLQLTVAISIICVADPVRLCLPDPGSLPELSMNDHTLCSARPSGDHRRRSLLRAAPVRMEGALGLQRLR